MNITTCFSIINKETNETLQLKQEINETEYYGIERFYSIDNYGEFGNWQTPDLWAVLLVKEFPIGFLFCSKKTPNCLIDSDKLEILINYTLNNSLTVSISCPIQSIFELVKDFEEFNYYFCHDLISLKLDKNKLNLFKPELQTTSEPKKFVSDLKMSHVITVLDKKGLLPDLTPHPSLFLDALQKLKCEIR